MMTPYIGVVVDLDLLRAAHLDDAVAPAPERLPA